MIGYRGVLNEPHVRAAARLALRARGFSVPRAAHQAALEEQWRLGHRLRDEVLRERIPRSLLDPVWERITERWREAGPGVEWYSHGATPVGFCDLCQLVLCGGTPERNTAEIHVHEGRKYIFCSEPCLWIFKREPERYAAHKDVVKRILAGEAPANLIELVQRYFGLTRFVWGKDVRGGRYPWLLEPATEAVNPPSQSHKKMTNNK